MGNCNEIFLKANEFKPDVFIGLGGGSPIDAGKAAWVLYENPDLAEMNPYDVQKEVPSRKLRQKAGFIDSNDEWNRFGGYW